MKSGAGLTSSSRTMHSSARLPRPRQKSVMPMTRAPTGVFTSGPIAITVPTTSPPGVNGPSFGLAGYWPVHMK